MTSRHIVLTCLDVQLRRNTKPLYAHTGFFDFWQLLQQGIEPGKGFLIAGFGHHDIYHRGHGTKRQDRILSLIGERRQ
ncbi:hypothetical protein UUA_15026 [Rhodanobacter thiooxydans LCS2]|nr:hypothetical protein UUA_15026 [Rhodanobacter thiooxydans LCS2]